MNKYRINKSVVKGYFMSNSIINGKCTLKWYNTTASSGITCTCSYQFWTVVGI